MLEHSVLGSCMTAKLFQMSGSSHALYFCRDTGVGHYFFLSLITSWWQIDQGFTGAALLAGVVWASHPRKEKPSTPSWCCPLDRSKPSPARTDSDSAQTSALCAVPRPQAQGRLALAAHWEGTGWLRNTFDSWKLKPDSESPVILAWLVVCEWLNVPSSPFHSSSK